MGSGVSEAEGGGVTLPLDKTRCLDTDCPQARTCARYLDRWTGYHWQQATFRRPGEDCGAYIEERKEEDATT